MPDGTLRVMSRNTDPQFEFRKPTADDGAAIHALIARCRPLDENSVYCNLLQCAHFADTCVLVEEAGEVRGFVSGYIVPDAPERLFIWQVAVAPEARGHGLGRRMILEILNRPELSEVRELHTTITPDNKPSQGVFRAVADMLEAEVERKVLFHKDEHFDGQQKSEILWEIGPFDMEEADVPLGEVA